MREYQTVLNTVKKLLALLTPPERKRAGWLIAMILVMAGLAGLIYESTGR
jgi:hypothetical protein